MDILKVYDDVYTELKAINLPVTKAKLVVAPLSEHTGLCQYFPNEKKFVIKIMKKIVDADNLKEVRCALAHELIHTCPGTYKHDKQWQNFIKIAEDKYHYGLFNIYDNDSLFNPHKKIVQQFICPECQTVYKTRKIIERARCP